MRQIKELYCIMPITNIPSVMKHGILSHNQMKRRKIVNHSVALQSVQDKREKKRVPEARLLHDYANLYFDAHNPMLSRIRDQNEAICVLRVSPKVTRLPGVVITDRNAAADYAGFYPYPEGLEKLNFEFIFAEFWIHRHDPLLEWKHKSIKCAEVLVPDCVEPRFLLGAYVYNETANEKLIRAGFSGKITKKKALFF